MPNAHNHRDAPPGTAVKYGNGELETIERLVDIGHYEVQVTPDNCAATLISVDQIVEDQSITVRKCPPMPNTKCDSPFHKAMNRGFPRTNATS